MRFFLLILSLAFTLPAMAKTPVAKSGPDAAGLNAFADRLYRAVDAGAKDQNVFLSPASVGTALAMTAAGARGDTLKEMLAVLGHADADSLTQAYATFLKQSVAAPGNDYQLSVANRLWAQRGLPLEPAFLDQAAKSFGAPVESLDYKADVDGSRKAINAWVEKQTADKIKELIRPGILTSEARLVLTNAIYFKGSWTTPFDKAQTKDAPFTLLDAKATVTVPLMHRAGNYRYADDKAMQYVELPYGKGQELAMLLMLPKNPADFAPLVKGFEPKYLANVVSRLAPRDSVSLFVPRFRMTAEFELSDVLKRMGMPLAFSDHADFSGITKSEPLTIDKVIHKAFVDVNEEGTEAAAATAVTMKPMAIRRPEEPVTFRADRSFAFVIRDTRTGTILFAGKVVNPKAD